MGQRGLRGLAVALAVLTTAAPATASEALFKQHCAACHQADASGVPGLAPPLTGPHWARLGGDGGRYVLHVLWHGLSGRIEVQGQTYRSAMPPMRQLGAADMASLAAYLRQLNAAVVADAAVPVDAALLDDIKRSTEVSLVRRCSLLGSTPCPGAR